MSDYLSRAAERASGTRTAVRPALPSVFDSDKSPADTVGVTLKFPEAQQHLQTEGRSNTEENSVRAVSEIQNRVGSVLGFAPEMPAMTTSAKSSFREQSAELKETPSHSRVSHPHAEVEPSLKLPRKHSPEPHRPQEIERVRRELQSPITVAPRRRAPSLSPIQGRTSISPADRESSSKPTIQVTIGRLEVRAVQSPPAPAKPASRSPRISLEEYLRSRNGGAG